ncbi:acetyl-CoA carboxylase carboxyltransferase subunit alpha [bacterium]|nr:acetyl-CoA carboxylase carboxyltransferase subunit alpha [bacterium]
MPLEFEFERPILELEKRLRDLQSLSEEGHIDLSREINAIASKIEAMKIDIFKNLEPWQVAQIARHPQRPNTLDYINILCGDTFVEIHGDREFHDDPAIVSGFGIIEGRAVALIGHQKGHDTNENLFRNFGMPQPEGFRKAQRLLRLAEKFKKPIIAFIDTPGAFPGIGAEERGQCEAIAHNIMLMARIKVPVLCFVIGEGGSGGALAIGVGDRVFMLENSVYSVISPEGCAAILWKDASKAKDAAKAMRIVSSDLMSLGVIDGILREPIGGAHHDYEFAATSVRETISTHLPVLQAMTQNDLLERRYKKFRSMGKFKISPEIEDA